MWARIVGSESQLMIFAEPDSAVSQPIPTPAASDATANTTANTATPSAAVFANSHTGCGSGPSPRSARRSRS